MKTVSQVTSIIDSAITTAVHCFNSHAIACISLYCYTDSDSYQVISICNARPTVIVKGSSKASSLCRIELLYSIVSTLMANSAVIVLLQDIVLTSIAKSSVGLGQWTT